MKFNLGIKVGESGKLNFSSLTVEMPDEGMIAITRDGDDINITWQGEIDTIQSIVAFLRQQLPGFRGLDDLTLG